MPKKKKTSDPVSRKALQDGIKELLDKNFSIEIPPLMEEAVLKIADGLEEAAKGLRQLAASWKLPAE